MKFTLLTKFWQFLKNELIGKADPSKTTWKKSSTVRQTGSGSRKVITRTKFSRIVLKTDHICPKMCVYRIWFGDKFYIGSTTNLDSRLSLHTKTILGCFNGERVGRNSQTNIMFHLMAHPSITEGVAEILSFVKEEIELVGEEKRWLSKYFNDPMCLNHSPHTTRKINGVLVRD